MTNDQRGVIRPQGAGSDIGAYEYDGTPFVLATDDAYWVSEDITLTVAAPGVLSNDAGLHGLTTTVGIEKSSNPFLV